MKKKLIIGTLILAIIIIGILIISAFPQKIELDEVNKKVIIDKPRRAIDLFVTGANSDFGITKDTEIVKLTLAGVKNDVFLCEGIHNPEIDNVGLYTSVKFVNCN